MTRLEAYRLSIYQDLGYTDDLPRIHLKRNRQTGEICVQKYLPTKLLPVYRFLKDHPQAAVPHIRECICTESGLLVVEEYIAGKTIREMVEERTFSVEEARGILLQLCLALDPLHSADPPLICRDIKPENLILDASGQVKIVDFDIARFYEPGKLRDTRLLGTPGYAAPEQFGYGQTDARTDIYALGVLLEYMVLKKFPSQEEMAGTVGMIVRKCTRMDPDQRYTSVRELAADLDALEAAESEKTAGDESRRN